jgi:hypothetical protein
VFKNGDLVVRDGHVTQSPSGCALVVAPERDRAIDRRMKDYYDDRYGLSDQFIKVPDYALNRPEPFEFVPCR